MLQIFVDLLALALIVAEFFGCSGQCAQAGIRLLAASTMSGPENCRPLGQALYAAASSTAFGGCGAGNSINIGDASQGCGSGETLITDAGQCSSTECSAALRVAGQGWCQATSVRTDCAFGIAPARALESAGVLVAQISACLEKKWIDDSECFRICGRQANTRIGPGPPTITCNPGASRANVGAADVDYNASEVFCNPPGWGERIVNLEFRGPTGETLLVDTAQTDSSGKFSYPYTAPAVDGEINVIVTTARPR